MDSGSQNGKILSILFVAAMIVMGIYASRVLPGYFAKAPAETALVPSSPVAHPDDYFLGNSSARAEKTIIEFGDYECPYCSSVGASAKTLIAQRKEMKLVWKDCPLPNHLNALPAATAARCAGEQGKFWEFNDLLSASYDSLNSDLYLAAAEGMKLDMPRFSACIADGKQAARVKASLAECAAANVTELPWFHMDGKDFSGSNAINDISLALSAK